MKKIAKTVFSCIVILLFAGCEQFTNPYDFKCPPEIWSPEHLAAQVQNRYIVLSWEESASHFDGFKLERSSDSVAWVSVNQVLLDKTVRNYTDTANLQGSSWYYRIQAIADKNQSYYSYSKAVCLPPQRPDSVSGPVTFKPFARDLVYTTSLVFGATGYFWSVPEGATLLSGQGTSRMIMQSGAAGGDVTVTAFNSCGNSEPQKLPVTFCLLPDSPGSIRGNSTVLPFSEDNLYSVEPVSNADSYEWQVPPGATINYGQGTTKISVDFSDTYGYLTVFSRNNCGVSEVDSLAITMVVPGK